MSNKINTYIIYSSWNKKNRKSKGTAIWKALTASHAGERHRKAFPNERIDEILPINVV